MEKEDDSKKVQFLGQKDILEIFSKLNINVDDIERCDIHSRYDIKEIHFKSNIDVSSFLGPMFVHAGWKVMTSTVKSTVTKVRFRNVPIYVPDEELFHLASFFGKIKDDLVTYEKHRGDSLKGLENGTRSIDVELSEGKTFMNYIWLAGPLPTDKVARITITHDGQKQQCSNCLRTAIEGCPAGAVGKLCRGMKTDTMSVENYMKLLSDTFKYRTLKDEYLASLKNNDVIEDEVVADIIDSTVKNMALEIELKEKITHLNAKLKIKEKNENEKSRKLDLLKRSVMEELKETVIKKDFEKTNMCRLVTQLSCVLDDTDSVESLEDGSIKLKEEMFFDIDAMCESLDENDKKVVNSNVKAFKKVIESRVRVRNTAEGSRRFSFGAMSESSTSKRKLSTENIRNVRQQIPQPGKVGLGKSGNRKTQTLSLTQFQNS